MLYSYFNLLTSFLVPTQRGSCVLQSIRNASNGVPKDHVRKLGYELRSEFDMIRGDYPAKSSAAVD